MAGILVLRGPAAATALLPSASANDGAESGATWNSGRHQGRRGWPMYRRFARVTTAVCGERIGKSTSAALLAVANSRPNTITRTLQWSPRCLATCAEGVVLPCCSSLSLSLDSSSHPLGHGQMLLQRRAVKNQGCKLFLRSIRGRRRAVPTPTISCEASEVAEDYSQQRSLEVTWSNPTGEILREVIPGKLWSADRSFVWLGIDVGGRMGVVRLEDGSIWVHSPVPLDADLKVKIDQLGPVRHIVSPNYEHCKYAQQWIMAYPEAIGYACPGLREKFPEIGYQADIGTDNEPPETWGGEFHCMWLNFERNPFNGKPFFNEVVFVHKKSGALFVTDFFWNYPDKIPLGSWLWKQAMDRVYLPFYNAFMIVDRHRFHKQLNQLLSWDWDCVFPCHGVIYLQGGKDALKAHYLSNGSLP